MEDRIVCKKRTSASMTTLFMVVCSVSAVGQFQTPNPDPRGLYVYSWEIALANSPGASTSLSQGGTVGLATAMNIPGIDGITIVVGWNELEPEYNLHQWDPENGQAWSPARTYLTGDEVMVGSKYYISQKDGKAGKSPTDACSSTYDPQCAWHETGGSNANILDEWIIAAIHAGKKITLAVRAGQNTPCWLFQGGCGGSYTNFPTPTATPLSFAVYAHQGKGVGGCVPVTMSAPWDPAFEAEWGELLDSLSTHLKETPSPNPGYSLYDFINVVRISGINRTTDETRIPAEILNISAETLNTTDCATNSTTNPPTNYATNSVDVWLNTGYTPSKLMSGWTSAMQSIKRDFGDKYLNVALIATDGGPQSTNRNGQFPFPMIDDFGCVYQNFIPNNFTITWTTPPCWDPATQMPDQNLPLMKLASKMFPGQLVAEVENLDFEFKNHTPQPAPAHPNVVSYAETLGTIPAFQTNDYLAPFPQRNGGAACWSFATIAFLEKSGQVTNSSGGRCFAEGSFIGSPASWYGEILSTGITPATTANQAWNTTVDPYMKSQMLEIFFADTNGSECTQTPLLAPTTYDKYVDLATGGPPAGCGYPNEIAAAHEQLISPPAVTITFPVATSTLWYTTLPVLGEVTASSSIGESISQLKCSGAASGAGKSGFGLNVNTQGGPALVTCIAADSAGNLGEAVRALWIDNEPPVTTALSSVEISGAAKVTFTATDNLSGVAVTQYRIDGGSWIDGTSFALFSIGEHKVSYRSIDVAGNVETTQSITVNVYPRVNPE